ncbi:MAG: glycosyltransferase [Myxococcales bacterium]
MSGPRVVLAHDWLTGMRGGERVLAELCRLFPEAPLYTLLHEAGTVSEAIEDRRIVTSALQRLPPRLRRSYRWLLPLMPGAVELLRLPPCDLVLSTSHCAIKAVRAPAGARHLCYVHTPMRYVWDQREAYFGRGRASPAVRAMAAIGGPLLRAWDSRTSTRVDRFVANSRLVQGRILRAYGRDAAVVHPPVELQRFRPSKPPGPSGFYLMVTAFAPYKRVDVAIEAFRRLGRLLRIVGDGQELARLRPLFGGTVEWLGPRSDGEIAELYARSRALVMPGEEDFGLTPLEAQASGRPVIALGRGGATETVIPLGGGAEPTGVLYDGGVSELAAAVRAFEGSEALFRPEVCRRQAERFAPERFRQGILGEVERLLAAPLQRV